MIHAIMKLRYPLMDCRHRCQAWIANAFLHTRLDAAAGVLLAGLCDVIAEQWRPAEVSHGRA